MYLRTTRVYFWRNPFLVFFVFVLNEYFLFFSRGKREGKSVREGGRKNRKTTTERLCVHDENIYLQSEANYYKSLNKKSSENENGRQKCP